MASSTPSPNATGGVKSLPDAGRVQKTQTVPRKRRRRTPIANASEDCSCCRKRETRCDRIRPYCSQCVELGRECPGYKTTLTWGVGVASRGKLRGLALPIANSKKVQGAAPTREARRPPVSMVSSDNITAAAKTPAAASGASAAQSDLPPSPINDCAATRRVSLNMLTPRSAGMSLPALSTFPVLPPTAVYSASTPTPSSATYSWDFSSGYHEHVPMPMPMPVPAASKPSGRLRSLPLQRVHTQFVNPYDDCGSPASTASWSDIGYQSPTELSRTPDEVHLWAPYLEPYPASYAASHQSSSLSSMEGSGTFLEPPRSCPGLDDMSSSVSSDQTCTDSPELSSFYMPDLSNMSMPNTVLHGHPGMMYGGAQYGAFSCSPEMGPSLAGSHPSQDTSSLADLAPRSSIPCTPKNRSSSRFGNLPARLGYLIHYYETAVCPFLSAMDDANPYICYILPLAEGSKSLQSAIAALALNNMRMRKISALDDALNKQHPNTPVPESGYRSTLSEPSAEEIEYKTVSIELLDLQLKDPSRAREDAVLATLLVLCLYHCCDSGFSKFRTQLAGVKMLLNLRERSQRTSFVCWVEMFFVWFDVFTSTVNDRETEIRPESLEMLDQSVQGTMEYHAGCDLRLFKLIARLGRLNLLSQSKPVRETSPPMTPRAPKREAAKDYYSLDFFDLTQLSSSDSHSNDAPPPKQAPQGCQERFWSEWTDLRGQLHSWDHEPSQPRAAERMPNASLCSATAPALPARQRDMFHINEAFRYSALLYVERLAKPAQASSSLDFQNIVAQSLYHITQISVLSCMNKFLLWPLFITGTECVDEGHRAIIRQRCIKIHRESGFFNNLSALEVLERVWTQEEQGTMTGHMNNDTINAQALRWRSAMDRTDGEYIII